MAEMTRQIMQMSVSQWEKSFPDEASCDAYLIANRWPEGVVCPRCGSARCYALKTMENKWECPDCREGGAYRFSHLVGTIFENTNVDLRQWFRVIHLMLTSKKGVSARQVHRYMGFGSYKTAWYMCHRIRTALVDKEFRKLMGIVEVDETFIGGEDKNRHLDKKKNRKGGTGDKFIVVGAIERKGNVVARVVDNVKAETLETFVAQTVATEVSLIATDDHQSYMDLKRYGYNHGVIKHSQKKYVVGAIHTNTIEGFWSILKRSIIGVHHNVSRKYLPLYVAERSFVYNNRNNEDVFGTAIAGC
jgi:transposase-like protein